MGYAGPSIFDKEDYAAMVVLNTIMSGYSYPGGWLFNELRGEGLVYDVHATQMTGPVPGYFVVLAQTEPEKIDEAVGRILKNMDKAKAGKIDGDEFDGPENRHRPARPGKHDHRRPSPAGRR